MILTVLMTTFLGLLGIISWVICTQLIRPSRDFCLYRKGGIADSANNSVAHVLYRTTHRLFCLFRPKYVRYSVVDNKSNVDEVSGDPCLSPRSAYSPFVLNMMLILFLASWSLYGVTCYLSPWAETKLLLGSLYRFRRPQHVRGDWGEFAYCPKPSVSLMSSAPRYSTAFSSVVSSAR